MKYDKSRSTVRVLKKENLKYSKSYAKTVSRHIRTLLFQYYRFIQKMSANLKIRSMFRNILTQNYFDVLRFTRIIIKYVYRFTYY